MRRSYEPTLRTTQFKNLSAHNGLLWTTALILQAKNSPSYLPFELGPVYSFTHNHLKPTLPWLLDKSIIKKTGINFISLILITSFNPLITEIDSSTFYIWQTLYLEKGSLDNLMRSSHISEIDSSKFDYKMPPLASKMDRSIEKLGFCHYLKGVIAWWQSPLLISNWPFHCETWISPFLE